MGHILSANFEREESIESLFAEVLTEARRRAGMDERQFARAINRSLTRNPGLLDASIRAYERGRALPGVDVYFAALALAGFDVRGAIMRWLRRGVPSMLALGIIFAPGPLAAAASTASPWW